VQKPEEKRPLGRPRRRWKDNIKMDHQELNVGVWTGSSWLRIGKVAGTSDCIDEPSSSIHIENPTRCNSVLKFYFIFI
jgi:hypothetical protein